MEDMQQSFTCPACGFAQSHSDEQCSQCGYTLNDLTRPLEIGTILESRYRIDMEVGRGGMGVVYRGTDLTLSRPVAIKAMLSNRLMLGYSLGSCTKHVPWRVLSTEDWCLCTQSDKNRACTTWS